ncbi:CRS2-associated factor 2 [Forsythia ovata]|uniref:CRS2-associated factor 2 n=1 Tax=Forsythia ovata TaxID=205694 RepID=A0ABD1WSZ3_9LAMI
MLGKGGVTHNMLEDIHNHWKRAEAVRIKCLGVPTLDIDNICFHLEEKTGGIIIYRNINILLLFRGRNYDPKSRPVIPLMLWKPYAPIYPKLVKNVAGGLTFEETKEMRNKGLNSPPLMKLSKPIGSPYGPNSASIYLCNSPILFGPLYVIGHSRSSFAPP